MSDSRKGKYASDVRELIDYENMLQVAARYRKHAESINVRGKIEVGPALQWAAERIESFAIAHIAAMHHTDELDRVKTYEQFRHMVSTGGRARK